MDWENDKLVSWTQFSNWMECPHRWYLMWQEGHKQPPTIHLTFGTALHETLQEYLERMYNQSIKSADEFDMIQDFQERMVKLYDETHKKMGDHYSNREEILEFIEDGFAIIDFFEKYRQSHFSKSGVIMKDVLTSCFFGALYTSPQASQGGRRGKENSQNYPKIFIYQT